MAIKLTKSETSRIAELKQRFEDVRDELAGVLDDIAADWRGQWDDKSEKWQEGEAGQEAETKIEKIETVRDSIQDASCDDLDELE